MGKTKRNKLSVTQIEHKCTIKSSISKDLHNWGEKELRYELSTISRLVNIETAVVSQKNDV